jgi:hypothetical protein
MYSRTNDASGGVVSHAGELEMKEEEARLGEFAGTHQKCFSEPVFLIG